LGLPDKIKLRKRKMKALFMLCEDWETCENKDLQDLFEKKVIEGKNFEWPTKQKLEELNEICSSCERSLELHEDECSVCGGTVLTTPPFPLPHEFETASTTKYFYECMSCKRLLYSFRKIS